MIEVQVKMVTQNFSAFWPYGTINDNVALEAD